MSNSEYNNNNNEEDNNNNNEEDNNNNNEEDIISPEYIKELRFFINFAAYPVPDKNTYEEQIRVLRFTNTSYTVKIYYILGRKGVGIRIIEINNGEKLDKERHIILGNEKSSIRREEQKIHSFELTNNKYPNLLFTITGLKYSMRQCVSIDELHIKSGEKEYIFQPENLTYKFSEEPGARCKQNVILQMTGGKRHGKKTRKATKSRKPKKTHRNKKTQKQRKH